MRKKVMTMIFAVMMTVSASAFAAVPVLGYSENGEYEAAVNMNHIPMVQTERQGYSENGEYTAVIITDVPQTKAVHAIIGYSENGEYQAART